MQLAMPAATVRGLQSLRSQAALFERYRGFDRCLRKLQTPPGEPLPMNAVAELYAHWGDPLTQGDESYLRSCLAEASRAAGPIVQCGASLLTLVLGSLCHGDNNQARQLWCLEHDNHWANVVRSWLTQYRIGSTHVITSRAQLGERFVWYGVDPGRLARDIALVLCEGARSTPHGVVGTLHRLGDRLADDFTVLARRISGAEDLRTINAWAKQHGAACVVVDRQQGFVKISRRPPA
jgi:hypothetical protein